MQEYITIKEYGEERYEDRKSVFIGAAMPVSTEGEALRFLESRKKQFPDARHHVYAYVLRENSIMRFSDDREPQGTAGMPVLDVIRKNGCTDVALVVTRYFGGTLLGTGGLVRAYTTAALGALKAGEIIKYCIYTEFSLRTNYSDYGKIVPICEQLGVRISDTLYGERVEVIGKIPKAEYEKLSKAATEATSGRAEIEIIAEKYDY